MRVRITSATGMVTEKNLPRSSQLYPLFETGGTVKIEMTSHKGNKTVYELLDSQLKVTTFWKGTPKWE